MMLTNTQIEQRLTAVESAVGELKRQLANVSPSSNWLEQITGSFKDEPAFDEVIEYGRAIREADHLLEDSEEQE